MKTLKILALATMTAAVALTAGPSAAWEPEKPIQIVVGFSPGGGTDVVARALVAASQEFFPVPLVIVNKAGAGGTLAADYVAKQKPDGYTLLVAGGSESTSVPNHRDVSYSLGDFDAIIRIIRSRLIVATKVDSGIGSIAELQEKAKANPGKLTYGSSGAGSLVHSVMLVTSKELGLDMRHLPYKGGAPMMAALLGGHIDVATASPDEAQPQVAAGKIKLLALSSNERTELFPDVPTLKELGHNVYIENQKGLVAPAGLPEDVYTYLHENFKKGLDSPVWPKMAAKLKLETAYLNGADFMAAMKEMSEKIGKAVKGL